MPRRFSCIDAQPTGIDFIPGHWGYFTKENTLIVLNCPVEIPVEMLPTIPIMGLVKVSETRVSNNVNRVAHTFVFLTESADRKGLYKIYLQNA